MRVFYVDDDRVNAMLFAEACRVTEGIEVETAGSGAEALELVRRWSPDLLVIDLHLPDTTGDALLPALRRELEEPALPAVLHTAEESARVGDLARDAGFSACWPKPVTPQRIASGLLPHRGGVAAQQ